MHNRGWISPPDSLYSGSSQSGITSAEASLPDSFNDPEEVTEQLSHESNSRVVTDYLSSAPSSQTNYQEITNSIQSVCKYVEVNDIGSGSVTEINQLNEHPKSLMSLNGDSIIVPVESSQPLNQKNTEVKLEGKDDEVSSLNQAKIEDENREASHPNSHNSSRVARGNVKYLSLELFVSNFQNCVFSAHLNLSISLSLSQTRSSRHGKFQKVF